MKPTFVYFKFIVAAACLLHSARLMAQPHPVADASVVPDSAGINTVSCVNTVVLEDTANVQQVEIVLARSKPDTIPLISQQFGYDDPGSLPSGWTYARSKNAITIGASLPEKRNAWYGSVRIKTGGSRSTPYHFFNQLTF